MADDAHESGVGETAKVGFCSILGLPNVGKSTLLNAILGVRLVAVSAKPQTTRNRILGVQNSRLAQIIFVDTPGVQHGGGALRRFMRDQALAAAGDCDVAVHVIDASDPTQVEPGRLKGARGEALAEAIAHISAPLILAINKIDKLKNKSMLLPILESYHEGGRYAALVPISAMKEDGVGALCSSIIDALPSGPRLFPDDMITDRAERFLAAELVREQLFRQLGAELPYASAVIVDEFDERADKDDIVIHASIYVERDSQKAIVIGRGGKQIKAVGERGRRALSELFRCPVHLKLRVKVASNWSQKPKGVRNMGYDES